MRYFFQNQEFARQRLSKKEARRLMEDRFLLLKTKSYRGMQVRAH